MAVSDPGPLSGDVTDRMSGPADDLSEFPFLDLPDDLRAGFEASAEILGVNPRRLGDAILVWIMTQYEEHPDQLPEGLGQVLEQAGSDRGIELDL